MKNMKAKALTEGAVCAALTVLFTVIAMYVPFFAMLSMFITGIPSMYLAVKHGSKVSVVSAVAAALVLFIVTGDILSAVLTSAVYILPGLAAGYNMGHGRSFKRSVFSASATIVFGFVLTLIFINLSGGGNGIEKMIDEAIGNSRSVMSSALDMLPSAKGIDTAEITKTMNTMFKLIKNLMLLYLPAIVIGISTVLGYTVTAVGIFVLRRLGIKNITYIPVSLMHASRGLCYAASILFLVASLSPDTGVLNGALKNLTAVMLAYIGVCGFSLVDYSVGKRISSGYLRSCLYIGVFVLGYFLSGFILQGLIILGMIDGIFNFRRLYKAGE